MFNILKPIIEKNNLFDELIGAMCNSIFYELNMIQTEKISVETQKRLDTIHKLIDCLESDDDYTLESEIDDLKGNFDSLLTSKIERDHYYPDNCKKFEERLTEHLIWNKGE